MLSWSHRDQQVDVETANSNIGRGAAPAAKVRCRALWVRVDEGDRRRSGPDQ